MRVFKTKPFARFADACDLEDNVLIEVVRLIESGLIHADLGGHVFKQRVARLGSGKSGGYRVLIVFKQDERAFFIHGFAKNSQSNIHINDLRAYRKLAENLFGAVER